jgi:hypothetical protein
MNANTDTLSARGVHRDEYERDREYHQNYEPHDQYSRWETTGAQRKGHWRILVAHVPVISAEMRSPVRITFRSRDVLVAGSYMRSSGTRAWFGSLRAANAAQALLCQHLATPLKDAVEGDEGGLGGSLPPGSS